MKKQSNPRLLTRRNMLKISGTGLGFLALGPVLQLTTSSKAHGAPLVGHKRLVIVNLTGGNDGLNTLVPIARSRYYDRRPGIAIVPGDELSLAGGPGTNHYGLHPSLSEVQARWNDGDAAFVNMVGYPDSDRSHEVSESIWSLGIRDVSRPDQSGWLARFADTHTQSAMGVVSVGMGRRRDFRGGSKQPMILDRIDRYRLDRDDAYRYNHDLRVEFVRRILDEGKSASTEKSVRAAQAQAFGLLDRIQEADDLFDTEFPGAGDYGSSTFGNRMRDIAKLIYGGFETKVFYSGMSGFDTHSGQISPHANLMTSLNEGLRGLGSDLETMNVWRDTVIVVISEFGRNNFENGSGGTDHGYGNCTLLLGGAVNGGVFGVDPQNADLDHSWLPYEIDFRKVYSQILTRHMGVDPDPLFPEALEKNTDPGILIA